MCFNERLKKVRSERGFTSKEMARALGVASSSYSQYENGKREPDVAKIKAISDILNVSADYLLFGGSFKTNSINQKCNKCIELLKKLDEFDIAEITGEIKQMLKAPKYTAENNIADDIINELKQIADERMQTSTPLTKSK